MKLTAKRRQLPVPGYTVEARRRPDGVAELWADTEEDLAAGLGFAHAHDREVQMMLVRLVGQGRLCECLQSDDDTLAIDVFFRDLGLGRDARDGLGSIDPDTLRCAQAYAAGVNARVQHRRRPVEFLVTGYRPDPWAVEDTLVTIALMTYTGLAQTQEDFEKLLIESIHGGVSVEQLKKLVAPHLDGLDDETVEALRNLRHIRSLLPPQIRFLSTLPRVSASNNWAVSGARTQTGSVLFATDPHLEINRLPALWYEMVAHLPNDDHMGITMPGSPCMIMGRTRDLAFGFTYGFMDVADFFIEEVRGGCVRRGDDFVEIESRNETILRTGADPVVVTIRETDAGVLEADPRTEKLEDGFYLTRAWSAQRNASAPSLDAIRRITAARTVPEAQVVLRDIAISCNWVVADREGNIGYQQSGWLPVRAHSGMYPVPAWDADLAWKGIVASERLHSALNPPEGFLATANDEINPPGGPLTVNLPMGSYRVDRIRSVLSDAHDVSISDMKRLQLDLYSLHAKRLMGVLEPLLPDTPAAELLRRWDLRYDRDSRAATVFEKLYRALLDRVFGEGLFGAQAWAAIADGTYGLSDFYHLFDNVLLGSDPSWYGETGRTALFAEVANEVLSSIDLGSVQRWGQHQSLMMKNIFFDGKLPAWLGFDYGPIELVGNRATVVQGGVLRAHNRLSTFAPSWRMVTDMAEDACHTVLPGGPSGRRFSRFYTTDIRRWLKGEYKIIELSSDE
jgi:penicillin amidase